jgi:hypothetical protein
LALTLPAGCGRSVGIVRLRAKTTEFKESMLKSKKNNKHFKTKNQLRAPRHQALHSDVVMLRLNSYVTNSFAHTISQDTRSSYASDNVKAA